MQGKPCTHRATPQPSFRTGGPRKLTYTGLKSPHPHHKALGACPCQGKLYPVGRLCQKLAWECHLLPTSTDPNLIQETFPDSTHPTSLYPGKDSTPGPHTDTWVSILALGKVWAYTFVWAMPGAPAIKVCRLKMLSLGGNSAMDAFAWAFP